MFMFNPDPDQHQLLIHTEGPQRISSKFIYILISAKFWKFRYLKQNIGPVSVKDIIRLKKNLNF